MATVIGLIGDGIGILSFLASLFGSSSSNVANVRVYAGLSGYQGLSSPDGSISSIKLFNENQQLIGTGGGSNVGSGGFHDFHINQVNQNQAAYAQIFAGGDAICIPYVTTTWVDGGQYGFVGDFGGECGLHWYYSGMYVNNGKTMPHCTWLSTSETAEMLMIHFPSFAGDEAHSNDPHSYCGYPALRGYTNSGGSVFKREEVALGPQAKAATRSTAVDPRLVVSPHEAHNATALCESETSMGPDFVSLPEALHCDMETREVLPLCGAGVTVPCFDLETSTTGPGSSTKRDGTAKAKTYAQVIEW